MVKDLAQQVGFYEVVNLFDDLLYEDAYIFGRELVRGRLFLSITIMTMVD